MPISWAAICPDPKPHIFFDAPAKPWTEERFGQALQKNGLALDLKTQMLCQASTIFINGDAHPVGKGCYRILRELADARSLPAASRLTREAADLLYQWYLDGYLIPRNK